MAGVDVQIDYIQVSTSGTNIGSPNSDNFQKSRIKPLLIIETPDLNEILILTLQAIKNLHPEVVLSIQRRALLSPQEKELLGKIKSTTVCQ